MVRRGHSSFPPARGLQYCIRGRHRPRGELRLGAWLSGEPRQAGPGRRSGADLSANGRGGENRSRLRSRLAWRQPSERRTHRERRDRCSAAPHRSVAADFGLRHLARSRSGRPLIDVPAQPAAVHLSTTLLEPKLLAWPVPPADTALHSAARALVGKSYAPSAPHAGQGTPDAESRRGAPPRCRRWPRCSWSEGPRAVGFGSRPVRAVPDPHASRASPGRAASCRCF